MFAKDIVEIFKEAISDYHILNDIDQNFVAKHTNDFFKELLYKKNWIDTVQWHYEDIVRDAKQSPEFLLGIKKRIDSSNQHRTDTVEQLDEYFYKKFQHVELKENAKLNSETPAWLLDRISILQLKIYHFEEQLNRVDVTEEHKNSVSQKLYVLKIQEEDMMQCYNELMSDLQTGNKKMRLYKQMKMYNDPTLNPLLYKNE